MQGSTEWIFVLFQEHGVLWGVNRAEQSSVGAAEFKEFHRNMRRACPDVQIVVHHVVEEGDTAFARWTATMTNTGEGLGMAPTNRKIEICGMSVGRVKDGKIVEGWNVWDQLGMVRQLGLLQGPAAQMFP
jgi:predicted ester cyclase